MIETVMGGHVSMRQLDSLLGSCCDGHLKGSCGAGEKRGNYKPTQEKGTRKRSKDRAGDGGDRNEETCAAFGVATRIKQATTPLCFLA